MALVQGMVKQIVEQGGELIGAQDLCIRYEDKHMHISDKSKNAQGILMCIIKEQTTQTVTSDQNTSAPAGEN